MKLAIDYDDTYTRDPELWDMFIKTCLHRGHSVYCVSARPEGHMDVVRETIGKVIGPVRCFGTGLEAKRSFMESKGHKFDVWIDDTPEAIGAKIYNTFIN